MTELTLDQTDRRILKAIQIFGKATSDDVTRRLLYSEYPGRSLGLHYWRSREELHDPDCVPPETRNLAIMDYEERMQNLAKAGLIVLDNSSYSVTVQLTEKGQAIIRDYESPPRLEEGEGIAQLGQPLYSERVTDGRVLRNKIGIS